MTFLHPEFLWGLLALAIPIIVHLFHFRRFKRIDFSNVDFLVNIEKQKKNKRKLKYYLILATRLMAVTFLVFAFAMPILRKDKESTQLEHQFISIYIDNSISMGTSGADGILLEVAKNRARDIVNNFKSTDKFQIVTNDFNSGTSRYFSSEKAIEKIDAIEISPSSKELEQVLNWQANNSETDKFHRFILSDFQRSIGQFNENYNEDRLTYLIPIPLALTQNMSIDSCWFTTPVFSTSDNIELKVKVSNYNDQSIGENLLNLEIDGQTKSTTTVQVEPNSSKTVSMTFKLENDGFSRGKLTINNDERSFDDALFFTINATKKARVLTISGLENNLYLDKLFSNNPDIDYEVKDVNSLDYSTIDNYNLLILNGCDNVSNALLNACEAIATKGGNILIIPSSNENNKTFNFFGFGIGPIQTKSIRFSNISTNHPFFQGVFEKTQKQNYNAMVTRYFKISGGTSLIGLANGQSFANIKSYKSGNVFVLASALNKDWSQFPTFDYFVPFMIRAATFGNNKDNLYQTVGNNQYFNLPAKDLNQEKILLHSEEGEFIPETKFSTKGILIKVNESIKKAGTYTVKDAKTKKGKGFLSFNYSRNESEVKSVSKSELESAGFKNILSPSQDKFESELKKESKGTPYWKYCISLVLLFLGIEILIIKLIKT